MVEIEGSSIKQKKHLNETDCQRIAELAIKCTQNDRITLKLELEYKLGVALSGTGTLDNKEINEFLYSDDQQLIGYIGICGFGGTGTPLEITGMVHPNYRRKGIFTQLYELAIAECKKRNSSSILLLCDRQSASGQAFLKRVGADYKHSEYEMYLEASHSTVSQEVMCGIALRKATNADSREFRGKGFGRALLLSAVKKLKESQTSAIMLQVAAENATALNLYKSCGFSETSVMDYFCYQS